METLTSKDKIDVMAVAFGKLKQKVLWKLKGITIGHSCKFDLLNWFYMRNSVSMLFSLHLSNATFFIICKSLDVMVKIMEIRKKNETENSMLMKKTIH